MRNVMLAVIVVVSLCGGLVRPALAQGGDNAPIRACTEDELATIDFFLRPFAQQIFDQIQGLRDRSPAELGQLTEELHRLQTVWIDDIGLSLPQCSRTFGYDRFFEGLLYESMLSVTLLQLGNTSLAEEHLARLELLQRLIQFQLGQTAPTSVAPTSAPEPTLEPPTAIPTLEPSAEPTLEPTTAEPTLEPAAEPTIDSANEPTLRTPLFLDDTSLLTGSPCAAPCWHGIIPGETPWEAATAMITADAAFAGVEYNAEGGVQQLVWQKAGSGQYCCRLIADDYAGTTVSYIFLALSSPQIMLGDVVAVHGEPAYVTTFPFTSTEFVVQLIYPAKLMVVSALVGAGETSLTPTSDVIATLYMDQTEMDLILQTTDLKAWSGYLLYNAYDQATPVVTPSVTLTPAY